MSLATEIQAAANKATDQWYEIVHAAAAGTEPSLAALTKVAAGLGITTNEAHAKLRQDVDVIRQRDRAVADLAQADANIAAVLAPYGGSDENFRRAVEAAESLACELRGEYVAYTNGHAITRGFAQGTIRRLEAAHPDLLTTSN
jgi:hypothetical protein